MRYQTIDRCKVEGCRCLDSSGVIVYDGPDLAAAEEATGRAVYPDPQVVACEAVAASLAGQGYRLCSRDPN